MSNCKFCGAEIAENTKFCSNCGAKVEEAPVVEAVTEEEYNAETTAKTVNDTSANQQTNPVYTKRPIKGGLLAWSIVNSSFGLIGCCSCLPAVSLILGVISIVLLILAQDAQTDNEEKSKIRSATILNIIASSLFVISIILVIILIVVGPTGAVPYNNFNIDEFMRMYPSLD